MRIRIFIDADPDPDADPDYQNDADSCGSGSTTLCSTAVFLRFCIYYFLFRAPEMIDLYNGQPITTKADIWVCYICV
jgi:hypothetical protein